MTTGRLVTQRRIRYGPFQTYAIEDYDPLTTVSIPKCYAGIMVTVEPDSQTFQSDCFFAWLTNQKEKQS